MKEDDYMKQADRGLNQFETDDDEENQSQQHSDDDEDGEEQYSSGSSPVSPMASSTYSHHQRYGDQQGSFTAVWPQSFRQSIDMFTNVPSPSVTVNGFLRGGSSLVQAGSSFLKGSIYGAPHDVLPPPSPPQHYLPRPRHHQLTKPLITHTPSYASTTPYHAQHSVSKAPSSFCELPPSPQCSTTQAIVNGMNVLCGVGLLTTPYALKEGGWLGMLLLFALGCVSCYTAIFLKQCLDSSPGLQTYPDIGQAAFGKIGRLFISIVLYMELYASCVEYVTLVSDSLSSMFPDAHIHFMGAYLNSHQLFALSTAMAVLPTVMLRDLSLLSYLSAGGVVASVVVVACLFWVGVVDRVGFHPGGTLLDFANLPVSLGLYGFCYSGHSVFPNIYSSMDKPSHFPTVIFVSFLICTILYAGVAASGFLMFGDSTKSQFTLNMPREFMASKVAVWTTVVNPLTKYALTMTPVALSLEELLPPSQQSYLVIIMIRTALVVSTLFVALAVPFFGFVMALLGSLFAMLVALILPCACYLSIKRKSVNFFQVSACAMIIFMGVVCACIGTYNSIRKIVDSLA